MTDPVFRPLTAGEIELFTSLTDADPNSNTQPVHETMRTGVAWLGRDYAATVEAGHYRPQWTWVAIKDDHVIARAAWYGGPNDDEPFAMDWFDPGDDLEIGAALIRAATLKAPALRKEYPLILPPNWREDPAINAAATRRIEAAQRAGMTPFIERLHLTWTAEPRTGRAEHQTLQPSGR